MADMVGVTNKSQVLLGADSIRQWLPPRILYE